MIVCRVLQKPDHLKTLRAIQDASGTEEGAGQLYEERIMTEFRDLLSPKIPILK